MNLETEVHVPLDDFVEYVQEQAIPRLPETKMGIKLKSTLKRSKNTQIDQLVEVMFKEVEGQVTATQSNSLDSMFTLLENILNYPYEDQFRVLDLEQFPDNKVLNMHSTHELLELIGFENGSLPTTWVFPHNKDFSSLLQALEALISKISLKIEELSSVNVESYMSFPFFQKYSELLGIDLTTNDKDNQKELKLTPQEANDIFEQTGCQKLEDYIIELGENSEEFQRVLVEILGESPRTNQFLTILREMWIECNVLRQTAVFLRQCFADPVSRAQLSNGKDKKSKLARAIVGINISEVNGIQKGTNSTVNTIEDIVYLFVERETYKFQKLTEGVSKVDKELNKGFSDDKVKVDKFWANVKNFMVERLSRKLKKKRDNISDQKICEWIECQEPELTIYDLPEYNRNRIENEDVLNQIEKLQINHNNQTRTSNLYYTTEYFNKSSVKRSVLEAARDEVWKPPVWLHQKQLVDDFIFFTILNELCANFEEKIAYNLKQCFSNFIIGNMPVLLFEKDLKNEKYANLGRKTRNWEQPLDIGWKMKSFTSKDAMLAAYNQTNQVIPQVDGSGSLK